MRGSLYSRWIVLGAFACLISCDSSRDRRAGEGVHPAGWAVSGDADFHGAALEATGYPLDDCRACHGDDFAGGDVGISCSDSSCHQGGVDDCAGTCHGSADGPRPIDDTHIAHGDRCATCHPVPDGLVDATHLSGRVDFDFSGLATAGGAAPMWSAETRSCSGTYCHQNTEPVWGEGGPLGCDGCHDHEPVHARFPAAFSSRDCADCHDGSPDSGHIDGALAISDLACDSCHGSGPRGLVPPGLMGTSDSGAPGVGAHERHTDSLLPGRIGRVVPCRRCHVIPEELLAPGHLDGAAPADVALTLGSYDADTGRCIDACHWDRQPGPAWNDDSGAERQCDSCHAFPPAKTRQGTPHPAAEPDLAVCTGCHPYSSSTHIDGVVDL